MSWFWNTVALLQMLPCLYEFLWLFCVCAGVHRPEPACTIWNCTHLVRRYLFLYLVCFAVVLLMPYGLIFWHIMILSFSVHCLLCSCYCTLMSCTLAFDANTYALYGDATLSIILSNQTTETLCCVSCV